MISAILGEMEIPKGEVCVEQGVAYVSQQAWMQNATLKENIIFGKESPTKSYEEVIAACALEPDLKVIILMFVAANQNYPTCPNLPRMTVKQPQFCNFGLRCCREETRLKLVKKA